MNHMSMNRATKFWTLPVDETLKILETTTQGISASQVESRRNQYGRNIFGQKKARGPLSVFFDQFASPLIALLVFAGAVTWYLGEHVEAGVIFAAVLINIVFGFYQEYKAENTIEQLASFIKNTARVIRDGIAHDINADELVTGDIVSIEYGNRVPADVRLLETTNLKIDESILTGESLPVEKGITIISTDGVSDRINYAFAGTYVISGMGLGVVVQTGNTTEIGKIATSVAGVREALTPVQNAVRQISWYIFIIALCIVAGIFALGISRGESVWNMLILSSAVAVGAVPEALPITLTVILSVGVMVISKKGGLIRKLSAAETLGSTTLVMTDKTGTLTRGELALDGIYTLDDMLKNNFAGLSDSLFANQEKMLVRALANTSGIVEKTGNNPSEWIYSGNPFDRILLKVVHEQKLENQRDTKSALVVPFNSTDKYSIAESGDVLSILGAPDILVRNSSLSDNDKQAILDALHGLGNQGKRLIALGQKRNIKTGSWDIAGVEILGMFAFSDTLRADAASSVKIIQEHGIAVKIITGDMPGTARFIAGQVGISVSDNEILTGDDVRNMDDADLKKILSGIKLFARVTPDDKLRIGNLYRELGEIVAMTGDGVNDAPALKAMNIGISLASGSDVAKSAADMILLDNNFKTITETITEGYRIRSNIQKVFVYLMSNSLDEVFVIAGALIAGFALPLNALQIIWVNILTGTLPALAFAYERNYTKRKEKGIFSSRVKALSLGIGVVSSVLLFGLYWMLLRTFPDANLARTIFFACFATYILAVSYSFRDIDASITSYNPFSNMRLNIANVIGLVLVACTIYVPFMQNIFNTVAIPVGLLWVVVVWSIANIGIVEGSKWVLKRVG